MSKIVVFGAGGQFGRILADEARERRHEVTAAVRDPAAHTDLRGPVVPADVRDAAAVAAAGGGHDVAIASLFQDSMPHDVFYATATTALLDGLAEAAVGRLLVVGLAATLEVAPGVRMLDAPEFPAEYRPPALGHAVALHVLRASRGPVDWTVFTPPPQFAVDGPRTGAYRTGGDAAIGATLSYADLAVAMVDEIERPSHHRTRVAVAD
jgi:putative NADH-flavin reductase